MTEFGKEVQRALKAAQGDLKGFDPEKGVYTPWYKLPFKVEFKKAPILSSKKVKKLLPFYKLYAGGGYIDTSEDTAESLVRDIGGFTSTFKRKIVIDKDKMPAKALFHEAIHADLVPIRMGSLMLLTYGLGTAIQSYADLAAVYAIGLPILAVATPAAAFLEERYAHWRTDKVFESDEIPETLPTKKRFRLPFVAKE